MAILPKIPKACTEAHSSKACDLFDLFKNKELTIKVNDQVCSIKGSDYQCGKTVLPQKFSPGFTPARLTIFKGKELIKTTQVYLPKPILTAKGQILEAELEKELTALLKDNSGKATIQIDGKTYPYNERVTTTTINNLLAAEGSSMRVYIGNLLNKGKNIIYGKAQHEEVISYNQRPVRVVTFGNLKISTKISISIQAMNDQESVVAIFSNHSAPLLVERQTKPTYSRHYKLAVHQRVYQEFFGLLGGSKNEANLNLLRELVGKHEKRHFDFRAQYGDEPADLLKNFLSDTIFLFIETDADLGVLEHLLSLSESNPEEAKRGLIIWSVVRGGRAAPENYDFAKISEELISNLMLSAMEIKRGKMEIKRGKIEVSWEKLRKNTSDFKQLLEKEILEDLASYSKSVTQGRISEPTREQFRKKIIEYGLKIDQWMAQRFNLSDNQTPFRISN